MPCLLWATLIKIRRHQRSSDVARIPEQWCSPTAEQTFKVPNDWQSSEVNAEMGGKR